MYDIITKYLTSPSNKGSPSGNYYSHRVNIPPLEYYLPMDKYSSNNHVCG